MNEKNDLQAVGPDDLFRLRFLQEAQLSPDGKALVYATSHVQAKHDQADGEAEEWEECVALWLLSLETGESRQLTTGLARDTSPRWSPDGTRVAFLSTRSGKAQIYLIPVDGGEAQALTSLEQGVGSSPVWSPDGRNVAFAARPDAESPDRTKPYRVTRYVYRVNGMGYLDNAVRDIYVISAEGGEPKRLTHDGWQKGMLQWSPDGKEILFSASLRPDSHRHHATLRVVDIEGQVREIVGDWGEIRTAAWMAPDGSVVFAGRPDSRSIGSKSDLWVIKQAGGEPECRTEGSALGVSGLLQTDVPVPATLISPRALVSRDGASAYVQVQDGGTVHIYRVALTGPESWAPVVVGERYCMLLDASDRYLLFAVSTCDSPADLYLTATDGSKEQRLTHLNAEVLSERNRPVVERLEFASTDSTQIEGWFLSPCFGTAPYPTILYIHGGPHSGFGHVYYFDFQMLAGAGYAVLFINQRGSTGYGDEFATQIIGDWGNLDYKDLMAGVDYAVERGLADPDRLGCCGLSGGGYLSCWIVGQTDRFKAVVPENPVTNWVSFYGVSDIGPTFTVEELGGLPHEIPEVYRRCSPITYAHRCKTPVLMVQGEADYCCPAEQSEQMYAVLKANGAIVEMLRFPASAHSASILGKPIVRRAQNEALLAWMNKYVLSIESEADTSPGSTRLSPWHRSP